MEEMIIPNINEIPAVKIEDTAFKRIPAIEIQDTAKSYTDMVKIENTAKPIIPTYIFSEAFYNKNYDAMSDIEKEVHNFLNNQHVNISVVLDTYANIGTYNTEKQFYLIPILILLINDIINNMRVEI